MNRVGREFTATAENNIAYAYFQMYRAAIVIY